jgi:hypothetical protein
MQLAEELRRKKNKWWASALQLMGQYLEQSTLLKSPSHSEKDTALVQLLYSTAVSFIVTRLKSPASSKNKVCVWVVSASSYVHRGISLISVLVSRCISGLHFGCFETSTH